MGDKHKTKAQLVNELTAMRQRVAELEKSENDYMLAEQAFREKEEMFNQFMQYSPIYVFFKDEQTRALQLSRNYEKMLGRPLHELIGKTVCDLFPSELAKSMVKDDMRILNGGESVTVEEELNGRFYTTTKFPITREGKPARLAGFTMDITEAKLTEKALREEEERFRTIFNTVSDAIFIQDLATGAIIDVNQRMCELYGYAYEEALQAVVWTLSVGKPPYTEHDALRRIHKAAGGEPQVFEWRAKNKAGLLFWVEVNVKRANIGGQDRLLVTMRDITERKQAEEELKATKILLEKIFESLDDAIFVIEPLNRFIITCNSAVKSIFGYETEEVTGKSTEFLHLDRAHFERFGEEVNPALEKRGRYHNEYVMRKKDGKIFPTENTVTIIQDASGLWEGSVSVVRDITERKQAEEALRQKEASYRELADSISDIFFAMDRDFKYTYWNKASEKLTGISAQDAIGKSLYNIFADTKGTKLEEVYSKALRTQQPQSFENAYRVGSNDYIFEINAYPSQHGLSVFVKDITERKQAEERLKKSESQHKEAQRVASIGHWELDPAIGTPTWSEEIFHIFGLDPAQGEPTFKDHQKIVHPDDWDILNQAVNTVSTEGVAFDIEFRLLRPDKSIRWMNARGYPIKDHEEHIVKIFGTAQDITRRKLTEEALSETKEFLTSILENAPMLIYANSTDDQILLVNKAWEEFMGLRKEDVAGHKIEEIFSPETACRFSEINRKVINTGMPLIREELVPKSGKSFYFHTVTFPLFNMDGQVRSVGGISIDVTKQKEEEKERNCLFEQVRLGRQRLRDLLRRLSELQEAERRSLSRELHDRIGQNLTALSINLDILRSQLSGKSDINMISRIEDSQKLLGETMDHIRDVMAELRPPVLDDYGLFAALRWYGERYSRQTQMNIIVQGEQLTPRLSLPVEIALFRIVQEALTNVVKHSGAKRVIVFLESIEGGARLTVSDDGKGFDPLAQHMADAGGEWGLITMRERAEEIGGELRIESSPGKGTKIILEVPRKGLDLRS